MLERQKGGEEEQEQCFSAFWRETKNNEAKDSSGSVERARSEGSGTTPFEVPQN